MWSLPKRFKRKLIDWQDNPIEKVSLFSQGHFVVRDEMDLFVIHLRFLAEYLSMISILNPNPSEPLIN